MKNNFRFLPELNAQYYYVHVAVIALAVLFKISVLPVPVEAAGEKYVTAYDYAGVNPITAPVRYYRKGYQVLIPNWGWTDCGFSCRLTLRKFHFNNKVDALNPENSASDLGMFSFSIPLER